VRLPPARTSAARDAEPRGLGAPGTDQDHRRGGRGDGAGVAEPEADRELDLALGGAAPWPIWFDGLATSHVDAGAR
jgi:hypothetical protein